MIGDTGRAAGHRRRASRVRDAAPRRGLPAPGRAVPGATSWTSWRAWRVVHGGRPRLLHAVARHRPTSRWSTSLDEGTDRRRRRVLRHGARHEPGRRLRAQARVARTRSIDEVPLPLPPQHLETKAVWWTIPQAVIDRARGHRARDLPGRGPRGRARGDRAAAARRDLRPLGRRRRLHAAAPGHGLVHDLHLRRLPGRRRHRASAGSARADRWLAATLEADPRSARARAAVPSCVQSPKCGNGNEPLDKQGAVALLAAMLGERWG